MMVGLESLCFSAKKELESAEGAYSMLVQQKLTYQGATGAGTRL